MRFSTKGARSTSAPPRLATPSRAPLPTSYQVFLCFGSLSALSTLCPHSRVGHCSCATSIFSPPAHVSASLAPHFLSKQALLVLPSKNLRLNPPPQKTHQALGNSRQPTILNRLASRLSNFVVAWCVFFRCLFLGPFPIPFH